MPKLEKATVQYGDMKGTAALDTFEGGGLHDLASRIGAKGFPVALNIYPALDIRTHEHYLGVTIYSTEVELDADKLAQYAEMREAIPTKRYNGRLTLKEFAAFAKRFEVVLISRVIGDCDVTYD